MKEMKGQDGARKVSFSSLTAVDCGMLLVGSARNQKRKRIAQGVTADSRQQADHDIGKVVRR